jgi:alkaline phosphatase D
MDRRALLRGGAVGVGSAALGGLLGCAPAPPPRPGEDPGPFDCGVASGLHAPGAAVLWTRFAPAADQPVELTWRVGADPELTSVIASGGVVASPDTDGCAKVLATGLPAGATLWYRFDVDGVRSPVGRTKVLPGPGSSPQRVRLAVASCQNYMMGWFSAWRAIAGEELDAVVHLGDYIYESGRDLGPLMVRADTVGDALDLAGYRAKYRLYRSDPDLRAAHAAHAFAPVWDDHEFVNDYNRLTLLEQPERAAAAYRAWFEYQPVWRIDGDRIHRRLRWGRTVELSLIDTRQHRDPQVLDAAGRSTLFGSTTEGPLSAVHDPARSILGASQRDWFLDGLAAAEDEGVRWKLVANQVMISPIRMLDLDEPGIREVFPDLPRHAGVYLNFDDWDGYQHERDLLLEHLRVAPVRNVGFLTGDIHSFWQAGIRADIDDDRSPVVAQEYVCGSISSRGVDYAGSLAADAARLVRGFRPGFRYTDFVRRGYGVVECGTGDAAVEFRTVNALSRSERAATPVRRARFDWAAGTQAVRLTRR